MTFLAIMFIGAMWAVFGTRAEESHFDDEDFDQDLPSLSIPPVVATMEDTSRRLPEVWQYEPIDEAEYRRAVRLHEKDPRQRLSSKAQTIGASHYRPPAHR
jgi:hypothetical protein